MGQWVGVLVSGSQTLENWPHCENKKKNILIQMCMPCFNLVCFLKSEPFFYEPFHPWGQQSFHIFKRSTFQIFEYVIPTTLMLRVFFFPVLECVDAFCWNSFLPTPPRHQEHCCYDCSCCSFVFLTILGYIYIYTYIYDYKAQIEHWD